jgi:hypothetical protein
MNKDNFLHDPALAKFAAELAVNLGLRLSPWVFTSYHFVGLNNQANDFGELILVDSPNQLNQTLAGFVVGNTGGKDFPQFPNFTGQSATAKILTPIAVTNGVITAMDIFISQNATPNILVSLVPSGIVSTEIPGGGSWTLKNTWWQWTWVGALNPATPPIPQPPQPAVGAAPPTGEFSK